MADIKVESLSVNAEPPSEEVDVPPQDVESFEHQMSTRTHPFTYLKPQFNFEPVGSDKIIFSNVIRALLGCSTFVDKMRQRSNNPIATEIRKLINIIAYKKSNLDITNLYRVFFEESSKVRSQSYRNNNYGTIVNNLSIMWRATRFRKILSIIRISTGYCMLCKKTGPYNVIESCPYMIYKYQARDPDFDLEDSLFAERMSSKYQCTTCGMVTDYMVLITTGAPDIITVIPPRNIRWKHPINITLPCEEARTHYYTLASYVYTIKSNNEQGVCTRTGDNDYISVLNNGEKFNKRPPPNVIKHCDLLCYTKVGSIDNYARVTD